MHEKVDPKQNRASENGCETLKAGNSSPCYITASPAAQVLASKAIFFLF